MCERAHKNENSFHSAFRCGIQNMTKECCTTSSNNSSSSSSNNDDDVCEFSLAAVDTTCSCLFVCPFSLFEAIFHCVHFPFCAVRSFVRATHKEQYIYMYFFLYFRFSPFLFFFFFIFENTKRDNCLLLVHVRRI